jgi:hypothetical protein
MTTLLLIRRLQENKNLAAIDDGARRARLLRFRRESDAEERIAALEDELGHLTLLCQALAELCLDKKIVGADALAGKMLELDALDGSVDGKLAPRTRRIKARKPAAVSKSAAKPGSR